jgi:hypothetical protein
MLSALNIVKSWPNATSRRATISVEPVRTTSPRTSLALRADTTDAVETVARAPKIAGEIRRQQRVEFGAVLELEVEGLRDDLEL